MRVTPTPPPAEGVRLDWLDLPARVRSEVESQLGCAVTEAVSQPRGFSPGVAARLRLTDGRRVFLKAIGPEPSPGGPSFHRREVQNVAALSLAAPVPRLLWSYDEGEGGWVVLIFEDVDGSSPAQPWRVYELDRVVEAMERLHDVLTTSPIPEATAGSTKEMFAGSISGWHTLRDGNSSQLARVDDWSRRHLNRLVELEEAAASGPSGDTLVHNDIRADNILLTRQRVWFVDWPHARVGPPWVDMVAFAPSVTMQGGPSPDEVIDRHTSCRTADPDAITAAVAALAGFFTRSALLPPPPGLPTLRPFQAAQGAVARKWAAHRTGWS